MKRYTELFGICLCLTLMGIAGEKYTSHMNRDYEINQSRTNQIDISNRTNLDYEVRR